MRISWFVIVVVLMAMIGVYISNPTPTNTNEEGAFLETGLEIDESMRIVSQRVNFRPDEKFYFCYYNNRIFGTDEITLLLIDNRFDVVIAEEIYTVDPESYDLSGQAWVGNPGRYRLAVKVEDQIRATLEIIISR